MSHHPCETYTIQHANRSFRVNYFYDDHGDAPWDNSDGHGPVSEWTRRPKAPGERILCGERGRSESGNHRYYDFAAAVDMAMKDGWGVIGGKLPDETNGQYAVRAVEADFAHLKGWCYSDWYYIGIVVTLLDAHGNPDSSHEESCWGFESNSTKEFFLAQVTSMADDIMSNLSDVNWKDDDIQFPRLLAEITAIGGLTIGQMDALAVSMGLTVAQISMVFDRAEKEWERIKARTPGSQGPTINTAADIEVEADHEFRMM